jgi:chromosome segregation ATPase
MEQRNEYIKKLEENIAAYNKKLADLKAKSAEVKADMKVEYLAQVESIEKKRDAFVAKCGELKEANEHAWNDVKAGMEKARHELEHSFGRALTRFR